MHVAINQPARMLTVGAAAAALVGVAVTPSHAAANSYTVKRIVTDSTGAPNVDKDLVNPWGLSQGPNTPVWVSDNGKDVTTLYTTGTPNPKVPLTVKIPGGAPTGQVFNAGNGFKINGTGGAQPALFIFDSEAGVLSAWNKSHGTQAVRVKTVKNAVFKGLTIAKLANGSRRLYAADFHHNRVDVFGEAFRNITPTGSFRDRNLPAGYAPFGIAHLRGRILVSYAKQDAQAHDDVKGAGHGFVDVYDYNGRLIRRLISRGALDSPWGMVVAPKSFGRFAGDLLVGQFGNGRINAYNPRTGAFLGALRNGAGKVIVLPGLWGLLYGNGTSAPTNALMFTAGPGDEAHGRFGTITAS
jgi:uncharacterized protein (TIGR03118 family)